MYQITQTTLAEHALVTITSVETGNYLSVLAGYGGALNAFVVNGRDILVCSRTAAEFKKITRGAFAGAQLFPFVNRINNARYRIGDKEYMLPQNDDADFPHSLHGLVYNRSFTVAEINEADGKIRLQYHLEKDPAAYPYALLLEVEYMLEADSIRVSTRITNLSEAEAPVGYGWHPYISADGKIDDCELQLPATRCYPGNERLIPDGRVEEITRFRQFARTGDAILNQCFEMPEGLQEHITTVKYKDGTVVRLLQNGFAYTQYYIPPDRKSIAIEPQTSIPDAFNNGIGLLYMAPGSVRTWMFQISVQKTSYTI